MDRDKMLRYAGALHGLCPPPDNFTPTRSAPNAADANAADAQPSGRRLRTAEAVRRAAETYVKRHGWPGRNKLAEAIGCAPPTLTKAINASRTLKARRAEAKAAATPADKVLILADEQAREMQREARQHLARRRNRDRSQVVR